MVFVANPYTLSAFLTKIVSTEPPVPGGSPVHFLHYGW